MGCSEQGIIAKEPIPEWEAADSGVPDEAPPECSLALPAGGAVPARDACPVANLELDDPWNVGVQWAWTGLADDPEINDVIVTPVVADLDQDGVPEVVFVAFDYGTVNTRGSLVVLDGATGEEEWTRSRVEGMGGPAIVDVDGDGVPEIIAFDDTGAPSAWSATGAPLWTSGDQTLLQFPQATAADLDGDGRPEIIAGDLVLDGATGLTLFRLSPHPDIPYWIATVADLDLDGQQEIFAGDTAWRSDGTIAWQVDLVGTYGHWSAPVQADGDAEGELAMLGAGELILLESNGTVLWRVEVGSAQPGPPCAADFDGDGGMELAWASEGTLQVVELDGTLVWSQTIRDASGLAGCSAYDVDGDGAYEIFYADEEALWIFRGSDGAIFTRQEGHTSGTVFEYPAVADVDADGSAEILIASNSSDGTGWQGVTLFGHVGDRWARSGGGWPVHDFAVTNVTSTGEVPPAPRPPWLAHGVYRARPVVDGDGADLAAEVVDWCVTGCGDDDLAFLAVQIRNEGVADSALGVPYTLYRRDGASLFRVASGILDDTVPAGRSVDAVEIEVPWPQVEGIELVLRVDDDGSGRGVEQECDEDDNEAEVPALDCDAR